MRNANQHNDAIKPTVKVVNTVSCSLFDDKIKQAGHVNVEKGKITIKLDHGFHMANPDATKELLLGSINLALDKCFDAHPEAFDPYST